MEPTTAQQKAALKARKKVAKRVETMVWKKEAKKAATRVRYLGQKTDLKDWTMVASSEKW